MTECFTARAADGAPQPLVLGATIHRGGGAGRIVAVNGDPARVVKLYHDAAIAAPYGAKIEAMLKRPPALPPIEDGGRRYVQIAWPNALVEDSRGRFRGFTMPFLDMTEAAPLETLLVKALRRHHGLPENYAYRLYAAQNVATAVAELHRLGHHIIDLKPQNLSIYKRSMYVAVVDCDGLSIDGGNGMRFPAWQFTDGYRAPETVSSALDPDLLGEEQDRFALAVVLFQLLNNGIHPFQGVPRRPGDTLGTEQERINQGLYPYGPRDDPRQAPSPGSIHEYFEDETTKLFRRAFDTSYRPRPAEWRDHLRGLIESGTVQKCARNPEEHAHFSKGCGLCAVEAGKKKRVEAAQKRARAAARQPRPGARSRIFGRGMSTTVIFQRVPQAPPPKVKYRQARPAVSGAMTPSGLLNRLLALIFGAPGQPVPHAQAGTASVIGLCIVYSLFVLNMLALIAIVTSLFMPRNFYDLSAYLTDAGLATETEHLSSRERLNVVQAYGLIAVFAVTILAQILCEAIKRAAAGTFAATHAQWLVRTFWMTPFVALGCFLIGGITWPWGLLAILCLPFWLFHRLAKGLQALLKGRPLPAPTAVI